MDPISDMFTRIQNGYRAKNAAVILPYSKVKEEILKLLLERDYISGIEKRGRKVRKFLEVALRYRGAAPAFGGFRRLSKSSRRLYVKAGDIRPVRQGFGMLIVSTPQGLKSGDQARKARLGGELIAEVW